MKNRAFYLIGAFTLALAAINLEGADSSDPTNHIPPEYVGQPFKGQPQEIPGAIKASDYDSSPGAVPEVTFSTKHAAAKTAYREDSVGINYFNEGSVSTDGKPEDPKQRFVGWTTSGEWLKYTVRVKESGHYRIGAKLAARSTGGTLTFTFGPNLTTGEIEIPTTTGLQPGVDGFRTWETLDHLKSIELSAGTYVMTVEIGKVAGFNLESFTFTKE